MLGARPTALPTSGHQGIRRRPPPAAPAAPAAVADLCEPRPEPPGPPAGLLPPAAVAQRLGVSVKALERWRGKGGGPRFVHLTRKTIRYRAEDVEAFVAGRIRASTAEG